MRSPEWRIVKCGSRRCHNLIRSISTAGRAQRWCRTTCLHAERYYAVEAAGQPQELVWVECGAYDCHEVFVRHAATHRFHHKHCALKQRRLKKRKTQIELKCPVCRKLFTPSPKQEYCSGSCRRKFNYRKNRKKYLDYQRHYYAANQAERLEYQRRNYSLQSGYYKQKQRERRAEGRS